MADGNQAEQRQQKEAEKENEATSSIVLGQPEPGRDIFADKQLKGVKSEPAKEQTKEEVKQEAVSEEEKVVSVAAPEVPESKIEEAIIGDNEALDPIEEPVKAKEGPLVEHDAVADQVAKELYPDAVD